MSSRTPHDRWSVPALDPERSGPATRFAGHLRTHPVAVFFAAVLLVFGLLAGMATLLGLLVTDVLITDLGLREPDESAVRALVAERTPALTDAATVGAAIGGAPVLPILAGLVAIVAALRRHWILAGFAVFVLSVESATYRMASLLVPRDRPDVERLENLPADASWPSGHTAASIAVYCGLAVLLTSVVHGRGARAAIWAVALALPAIVALSRMYQGMHHPLDVAGGALIGAGAIAGLLFACRAAGAAVRQRAGSRAPARAGRGRRLEAVR